MRRRQKSDDAVPIERPEYVPFLAAVAGWVDAVTYLTIDVFTAHMSGNSARLGAYVSRFNWATVALTLFTICLFVVSVAAGAVTMELGTRRGRRPGLALLGVEAALLLTFAVYATAAAHHGVVPKSHWGARYGLVACAVVAMAFQTAALQRVSGRTVRTTYVTGMLTKLADGAVAVAFGRHSEGRGGYLLDHLDMSPPAGTRKRVALLAGVWVAYAAGAIAGALLHRAWGPACAVLPSAGVVVVAGVEAFRGQRS